MKRELCILLALPLLPVFDLHLSTLFAQGTAFTYQGRLSSSGSPAGGTYDFRFRLAADPLGNTYLGSPVLTNGVAVNNGLFVATIDFGPDWFNGSNYWLEVDVRTNRASGYSALTPLQMFTPTPYAIFATTASNLSGTLPTAQLSGTVASANFSGSYGNALTLNNAGNSFSGSFTGNGGGLTSLNAAQLTSIGNTSGGVENFFVGPAGNSTASGSLNTANGVSALANVTYGSGNTADGAGALYHNLSGSDNAAVGRDALYNNTSGYQNTAIGRLALSSNTNGFGNTALGYAALSSLDSDGNTAIGYQALHNSKSGLANIALGPQAGNSFLTNESNNIDIGNAGMAGDNNTIRIGTPGTQTNTYIAGVINGNGSGLTSLTAANLTGALPTISGANLTSLPANAALLGGAQTFTGPNVFSATLSFGASTRQMLNLYSNSVTTYAIGVQNQDTYFRCGADVSGTGFAWYRGGVHNDNPFNNGGGTTLMTLTTTGLTVNGTFVSASDRNVKQDFAPVDSRAVLEKVSQLPVQTWAYQNDPGTKHLGPMAQDFYAAFNVGPDDKHITTVDEGGVALAAIQGLNQKVDELKTELKRRDAENAGLKHRLEALEKIIHGQPSN